MCFNIKKKIRAVLCGFFFVFPLVSQLFSFLSVKSDANVLSIATQPLSQFYILGSSPFMYLLFSLWLFNTET